MVRVCKCNRCGVFYEPQEQKTGDLDISEVISTWGHLEHDKKDICPACRKELAEWWNLER